MTVQKFFKGDLVRIGSLPASMSHFPSNCEAIVLHSDKEDAASGAGNTCQYAVYLLGVGKDRGGYTAWYPEDSLTFIREDAYDALPKSNYDRQCYEAKLSRWYSDYEKPFTVDSSKPKKEFSLGDPKRRAAGHRVD